MIKAKKLSFAKIADEIEEHVALAAEREEAKLKYYTNLEEKQEQKQSIQLKSNSDEHNSSISQSRHCRDVKCPDIKPGENTANF